MLRGSTQGWLSKGCVKWWEVRGLNCFNREHWQVLTKKDAQMGGEGEGTQHYSAQNKQINSRTLSDMCRFWLLWRSSAVSFSHLGLWSSFGNAAK